MTSGATEATFAALVLPFLGAVVAPVLAGRFGARAAWGLAVLPALSFLHFCSLVPEIAGGAPVTGGYAWVPSYNLSFSWYLDGLSLTFALLVTGIGALIVLYAGGYLKGHVLQGRFLAFLFLFMGAMLGLVVSDSFLMLFIFWEMTSITSFLLIGFDHERRAARRAALQALVITGGGGLFLLAGLLLLWNVTDVTQMSLALPYGEALKASPYYLAVLLLVLMAAFTKSAQFPFHAWLPNAMEAPTPVSAYLHSATMVKAGIYLLMRLYPALGGTAAWEIILPVFGGLTLIVGAVMAVGESDLKRMLAYTTLASLGLLVLLLGAGGDDAVEAAVLYLMAHALFKGAFFMLAGILDHETGSRDITALGGLVSAMPLTFAITLAAALSMGGLPPFFGFLAKEEIYAALAGGNLRAILLTATVVLGNALMFAAAFVIALKPFLGARKPTPRAPHEAPILLWLAPAVLALAGLVAALLSPRFHALFSTPMASAVRAAPAPVEIGPMPHFGLPLLLSVVTILVGIGVWLLADRLRPAVARLVATLSPGPDAAFDEFIAGLLALARRVTRLTQPGRLHIYMTVMFATLAAALFVTPALYGEWPAWPRFAPLLPSEAMIFAVAVIGLGAVITARQRLTAIVALGIQGFAVAVIFVFYSAPDLAFTQFMVETLSVVILTLVMMRLRLSVVDRRAPRRRLVDGALALGGGFGLVLLTLKTLETPFDPALSLFFGQWSRVIAHGRNVVNVIIVDFRGTDTLGEIAVVTAAGLAVLALLRRRSTRRGKA